MTLKNSDQKPEKILNPLKDLPAGTKGSVFSFFVPLNKPRGRKTIQY